MLVLTRKLDESIVFPELGITVRVVGVGPHRVRLGITADRKIAIRRSELSDDSDLHHRRSAAPEPGLGNVKPLPPAVLS